MSYVSCEHVCAEVRRRLQLGHWAPVLALLTLAALVPAHAFAGEAPRGIEPEAKAKSLVEEIKGLRKAKDSAALRSALERLVPLHNALENKTVRHELQRVAGQVLTDKKLGTERVAAAEALGKLNDSKGGFKHLKRALPSTKTETADPVELAALRAVAALAHDGAIPTLVDLMSKGKDNNVSKAAVVALGAYGKSKKRVTVLKELVDYIRRSQPRYTPGKRVGAATRERWAALGRPLVSSLNRLTGQGIRDVDEWLELYKSLKKKPKNLFVDED